MEPTKAPAEARPQPQQRTDEGESRAKLSKTLKPSWVWAIALGSAVGWGAFVLPADWMGTAGPLGAIIGFLIGGALMAVIAVSYGFLIRSFPVSGGEFAYTYVGFGRKHALFCGWFLTLGYVCIVALNASALALLARYVLPQVAKVGFLYEIAGWDVYLGEVLIASLALVVFAAMNIKGANISGLFGGIGIMLLALSLSMGISTGLNGFYVAASRLLFAMGRARMIPTAFAKLHPRYRTPYIGIGFVAAFCLIAPWFGRAALLWVVDMSSVGVTIAYTYACLVAFKQFRWSHDDSSDSDQVGRHAPVKKSLSLLGVVIGLTFLGLLLIPASPAALGPESAIALAIWIALGLTFFVARRRRNAEITDAELDRLVLGDDCPGHTTSTATPAQHPAVD